MARLPRAQRRCHGLRFGRALPVCRHRRLAGAWGSIAMYKSRLEVTASAHTQWKVGIPVRVEISPQDFDALQVRSMGRGISESASLIT